jgi:hypothetical protein
VLCPTLVRAMSLSELPLLWHSGQAADQAALLVDEGAQQEMSTMAPTDGQALLADEEGHV